MSAPSTPGDAVRRCYAEHRDAIWRYVLRRTGDRDLAEDVTSEVFVVAWRRAHEPRAVVPDLPWLYGVARKLLANARRAHGRRAALVERLAGETAGRIADDEAERLIDGWVVRDALEQLAPADREVLRLAAWEGLEPHEIAVVLACRPGTARIRLHRARRRLGALLDHADDERSRR